MVNELVSQKMQKGNHAIEWKKIKVTPGVYFYTLETNNFIKTKKMLIFK